MLVDSHCHLDSFERVEIPPNFIVFTCGYSHSSNQKNALIAKTHENAYATLGIAPQTAQAEENPEASLPLWENFIKSAFPCAIGEIGLDFHWAKQEVQKKRQYFCFNSMLSLASSLSLPVVLHCRDAYPELFEVLKTHKRKNFMLHCFSGTESDAKKAIDLGGIISIPPIPSKKRKKAIIEAGIKNVVAETDAPYIGKTLNDINLSLKIISDAFKIGQEEAQEATSSNARKFFRV